MCGIAGYFFRLPVQPSVARRMHGALAQRGPDSQHAVGWTGNRSRSDPLAAGDCSQALLHTRLSIIDPRPLADQPMSNAAGDVWLCYNGEVYDWSDAAAELVATGVVFRTHSDTEFILHGYQAWGIDRLLERLRGMFAFAIVDWRIGKVFLARDRLGEKPLVYSLIDGNLSFGSLVRSVLPSLPADHRGWSIEGIDAYLAHRYIPAPRTVFEHIHRLPAAFRLEFDLRSRELISRRYWQPSPKAPSMPTGPRPAGDALATGRDDRAVAAGAATAPWLAELDRAVEMRTVADRPLGMFLSGGIDSTVIASRLVNHGSLRTFTAAFPGSSMDESPVAASTAASLGLVNQAIEMPIAINADLERIVADLDEPFADPSCLPTWYLARAVSQQVKVVLVGDGGDELLAGYKRVAKHLRTAWRAGFRVPLPVRPSVTSRGLSKLATELSMSWADAYALRFSGLTPGQRRLLQPGRALPRLTYWHPPAADRADRADRAGVGGSREARLSQLLAIDMANYLPEYVLRKSDLCTMAHGLEARGPMLDHHFVETMLALPAEQRFSDPPKKMFAAALSPKLPADFLTRKKRGFNPPLTGWLRGELAPRLDGLGQRLADVTRGQLDASACQTLVDRYRHGTEALAEQVLQLLLLSICLAQLKALADDT